MLFIESISQLKAEVANYKKRNLRIGFVPTMGNLHEGHLQLIDLAKKNCDVVVCSIFVNPTQFGENEDFSNYPRTLNTDKEHLEKRGCDLLFFPSAQEIYPQGNNKKTLTLVQVPDISEQLCGASRPGHFDGVSTVVTKLFNLVSPDAAIFGEKDFQQLLIIKKLIIELNFPIEIIGAPISREASGLARSSRNNLLSEQEKKQGAEIYNVLCHLRKDIVDGRRDYSQLVDDAQHKLNNLGFKTDYVEIRNSNTLKLATERDTQVIIFIAAFINKVRLIDNLQIDLPPEI